MQVFVEQCRELDIAIAAASAGAATMARQALLRRQAAAAAAGEDGAASGSSGRPPLGGGGLVSLQVCRYNMFSEMFVPSGVFLCAWSVGTSKFWQMWPFRLRPTSPAVS